MDEVKAPRPLAVVTGASSGIGYHLALLAAQHGHDLVVAADRPLGQAVVDFRAAGARRVQSVQAELASRQGVDPLIRALQGHKIDVLMANAGHGLAGPFLEQDFGELQQVIDTNITGTLYLLQHVVRGMVARGRGRVLVTGSVAGFQPGSLHAVYNGSKAFIDSFAHALRNEIKDTGVTLSLLIPGPTDTDFFERAHITGTRVGAGMKQDDPSYVARLAFDAMLQGEADVVSGWRNKAQVAASKVLPAQTVAQVHRKIAEPDSGKEEHSTTTHEHPRMEHRP